MLPSLPVEIWTQIVENLCVHCQQPNHSEDIPDFRLPDARAGKAALNALCLVSRQIRAMSQGILYHYFSSAPNGGDWIPENRYLLPCFLRAMIANPSLGPRVRIMALFGFNPIEDQCITREDLQACRDVSAKYGIPVPVEITEALDTQKHEDGSVLFFERPGPSAQLRQLIYQMDHRRGIVVYGWLHILALTLAPNVTHLQLKRKLGLSFRDLPSPPPVFPQLRVLTYDHFTNVQDVVELHTCFPNVTSLCARKQLGDGEQTIRGPISTMNIRKLSVCCTPRGLTEFLQLCPKLEELECHLDVRPWVREPAGSLKWPAHTKSNLRRLAFSNRDIFGVVVGDGDLVAPLKDFQRLEILEIGQSVISMYSTLLEAKNLSSTLPETLRILQIAFARDVYSHHQIARQLRDLVRAKYASLPKLSIVKVGDRMRSHLQIARQLHNQVRAKETSLPKLSTVRVGDRMRPCSKKKTLPEFIEMTDIRCLMEEAGIDLRFGLEDPTIDKRHRRSRSILPQPPGVAANDNEFIFQRETFSLDDLALL